MSDDPPRRWLRLPTREEWLASLPPAPPRSQKAQDNQDERLTALRAVHAHWGKPGEPCCAWCGQKALRKLQIDHLYSDGWMSARGASGSGTRRSGIEHYRAIKRGEVDLSTRQLLCASCNAEKRSYEAEHGLLPTRGSKSGLDKTTAPVVDLVLQGRDMPLLDPAAGMVAPEERAITTRVNPSSMSLPFYDCRACPEP